MFKRSALLSGLLLAVLGVAACAPAAASAMTPEAMMKETPDAMIVKSSDTMMKVPEGIGLYDSSLNWELISTVFQ